MSEELEEVNPGVYKIPEEDLKRLRANQERRNQRAVKRRSNSTHRTYSSGRRRRYVGLEMFEPSLADIMEHKEEQQEADFIENQLEEFVKGGLK